MMVMMVIVVKVMVKMMMISMVVSGAIMLVLTTDITNVLWQCIMQNHYAHMMHIKL